MRDKPLWNKSAERMPEVDLSELECRVTIQRHLVGAPLDVNWMQCIRGTQMVTAEVIHHVPPESWDDEPKKRTIGRASALTVEMDRTPSAFESLDHLAAGTSMLARMADDLVEQFEDDPFMEHTSQLVAIEDVRVSEAYRGQRIGPRLVASLVEAVSGGSTNSLVVLDIDRWIQTSEIEERRWAKKMKPVLESMGFQHHAGHGYWRHTSLTGGESLWS